MKLFKSVQTCPSDSVWRSYFFSASDDSCPDLDEHLDSCERCQKLLRQLTPEVPSNLVETIRTSSAPIEQEEECLQFVANAKLIARQMKDQSLVETKPQILLQSLVCSRYQIKGIIGKGGMGTVFRAQDLKLNREVALKTLDPQFNVDFDNSTVCSEAHQLAKIDHRNVVTIYEADEHLGTVFLTMPVHHGGTLAEFKDRLPVKKILSLMQGICKGVSAAHSRGMIHRDLKPSNILLSQEGEPIVTDFGLALDNQVVRKQRYIAGTANYMAPEQWGRPDLIDTKTDIYGIGGILHFLLWQRPPSARVFHPGKVKGKIRDLAAICERCLFDEQSERYASADEVLEELVRVESGYPAKTRSLGFHTHLQYWIRRHLLTLGVLLLLTISFGWASISHVMKNDPPTPAAPGDYKPDSADAIYANGIEKSMEGSIDSGIVKISEAISKIDDAKDERLEVWQANKRFWEARRQDSFQKPFSFTTEKDVEKLHATSFPEKSIITEQEGVLKQWNRNGEQFWSEKFHEYVLQLHLNRSSQYVVTRGFEPHAIKIFDLTQKEFKAELKLPESSAKKASLTTVLASLVDFDRKLIVTSRDPKEPIQLYTFDPVNHSLTPVPSPKDVKIPPIQQLVVQQGGFHFATVSDDNSIRMFNARTGALVREWPPDYPVAQVSIDNKGGLAVLVQGGKRVNYYCLDETCQLQVPVDEKEQVEEIEWTGAERGFWLLIKNSGSRIIRQWNPNLETFRDCDLPAELNSPKLSNDFLLDISTDRRKISGWSISSFEGTLCRSMSNDIAVPGRGHVMAATPNGSFVSMVLYPYVKPGDKNPKLKSFVRVFAGNTLIPVAEPWYFENVNVSAVALSNDGSRIAIGTNGDQPTVQIATWDSFGRSTLKVIDEQEGYIRTLDFDSKGRLVSGNGKGKVTLFDTNMKPIHRISFTGKSISQVRFSPSGDSIVVGTQDGSLYLLDTVTGNTLCSMKENETIRALSFSHDEKMIAVGLHTHWAVWPIQKGVDSPTQPLKQGTSKWIHGIHFTKNDGMLQITEIDGYRCFSTKKWDVIGRPLNEPRYITGSAYTNDGSVTFSVSANSHLIRKQLFINP